MTEGVSTRLQKDLDKLDARIDEKMDKLGDRLRTELFAELHHAMDHFNSEVASIKQLMIKSNEGTRGKSIPEVVELTSSEQKLKNGGNSSELGNSDPAMVLNKVGGSSDSGLDMLKFNPRRNTLDCPRFDG